MCLLSRSEEMAHRLVYIIMERMVDLVLIKNLHHPQCAGQVLGTNYDYHHEVKHAPMHTSMAFLLLSFLGV